jgi:hypothetical protein
MADRLPAPQDLREAWNQQDRFRDIIELLEVDEEAA